MGVDISIIVPVFNEAENVLPLARQVAIAMAHVPGSYELVFVDDASTDTTWQQIQEASRANEHVRGLRHRHNAGQSAAVWTGIQATTSPVIATLDGDLQNDPADLPKLLARLNEADFVSGMRLQRRDTLVRRLSSRVAFAARKCVLKATVRDTGCALRAMRRCALEGVFPFNGFHRFLPVLVQSSGIKTLEIPVNHRPRVAGVSKYGVWNRLWRGIYDLVGLSWYQTRRLKPVPCESQNRVELVQR